jgi:hypothetical protein
MMHALAPLRLLLCLAATAASMLAAFGVAAAFDHDRPPVSSEWLANPLEQWTERVLLWAGMGMGTLAHRLAVLALCCSAFWGPVGAWLIRSELDEQDLRPRPLRLRPTELVTGHWRRLASLLLVPLAVIGCLYLPALLVGVLTRPVFLFGMGAVLVALALPMLMLFSFLAVFLSGGVLGYGLMPATVAAQGDDSFDALTRSFGYFWQGGWRYPVALVLVLTIAAVPLAGIWLVFERQPDLLPPAILPYAMLVGLAAGASLWWSMHALVFLKMRQDLDDVAEDEIWDGRESVPASAQPGSATASVERAESVPARATDPDEEPDQAPSAASAGERRPEVRALSLRDTFLGGAAGTFSSLVALLGAVVWNQAMLLAAGAVVCRLAGSPGHFSPLTVRDSVVQLGSERPLLLALLGLVAVGLGVFGVGHLTRSVARLALLGVLYGHRPTLAAVRPFTQGLRRPGFFPGFLVAAGLQVGGVAVGLGWLAWLGQADPAAVFTAAGLAIVLLAVGSFGLGAVAVDGNRREGTSVGPVEALTADSSEVLTSALLGVVYGAWCTAVVVVLAALQWGLLCDCLRWGGGEHTAGFRWGLDGRLVPESAGGLYTVASWIAGFWFAVMCGLVLTYPFSYVLCWGVATYALARQRIAPFTDNPPELTADERDSLTAVERGKTGSAAQEAAGTT